MLLHLINYMNYKTHQGVTLPVLGIGSWEGNWGRDEIRNDPIKDKICKEAIVYAIQNGMTHIDTAELYGSGRSEIIIGEAINNFDRNKLFITSKVKRTKFSIMMMLLNLVKIR